MFFSILVVLCFMWSAALDSCHVLLSYPSISVVSHITTILISALKHTHQNFVLMQWTEGGQHLWQVVQAGVASVQQLAGDSAGVGIITAGSSSSSSGSRSGSDCGSDSDSDNVNLYVLTGIPSGKWAEPQKREWYVNSLCRGRGYVYV